MSSQFIHFCESFLSPPNLQLSTSNSSIFPSSQSPQDSYYSHHPYPYQTIYNFMLVRKLLSLQKKQPQPKPQYKKPVYKSYKQLLHLDRPRKKIQYESSSSDQDFLQRLLNEEAQRSKSKKKRKKTADSAKRRGSQERQREKIAGREDGRSERRGSTEIKLIRESEGRAGSANEKNNTELALIKEEKPIQPQAPTIKFIKRPSQENSLPQRKSIYIDNKSVESPLITYSSTNHLFRSSLKEKRGSGYQLLLAARKEYEEQAKPRQSVELLTDNKLQYNWQKLQEAKFRFAPKIDPITPNWRYNLTVAPIQATPQKEFVDRKNLFRSQEEEERFVRSLRELSRRKY